jgi:CHASE2 domain-containing sensor protein/two-component sensor histidine kinase
MSQFKSILRGTLPGLAVIAGLLILRGLGAMQSLEFIAFDQLMRLRPQESIDSRVVIIGITEKDLQQLGRYPVTDRILAQTIQSIAQLQPAAIGVDIFRDFAVPPGTPELQRVIQSTPNLLMAYRYTKDAGGSAIAASRFTSPEQQGFVDSPLDADTNLRRLLLGFQTADEVPHTALFMQLAMAFLERSPDQPTMEPVYPFITPGFGAYQGVEAAGDQVMLNPRNHPTPFRQFSLAEVQQGQLKSEDIAGKVVLIGLTAISIKDVVSAMAIQPHPHRQSDQVDGVAVQAHAVSQMISTAVDHRPQIQSCSDPIEMLWIIGCGLLGVLHGRLSRSPMRTVGGIGLGIGGIGGLSYGLLVIGWWIPLVPAVLAFFANASGFVAAQIYQREQDLRLRLHDRQQLLEQTFTAVHNGPLQDLAGLSRQIQDVQALPAITLPEIAGQIQQINQELRGIFESTELALIQDQPQLYLSHKAKLNLQKPLHELLEQVYNETCARELSGLGMIQIKIVQFQPIDSQSLNLDQKQALCRFLEEALRNIGKHAPSATKLWVYCGQDDNQPMICIKDNGQFTPDKLLSGAGTKQAKRLARQLRGEFERRPNQPQGTVCQLRW